MLRRRFFAGTIKLLRVYAQMMVKTYNKVKTVASSIPATLAKLESVVSSSYKADSTSYEASVSNVEVHVGISPSFDASGYEVSDSNVNVAISTISDIDSEAFNASVGEFKTDVVIEKSIDALSAGASVGDSQKVIKIGSSVDAQSSRALLADIQREQTIAGTTEPLSGDAKLNQLKIKTHDIPTMIAVASSKIYSQIDTTEGVVSYVDSNSYDPSGAELELSIADSTLAVADKFESEPVTMNTHVSAGISTAPEKFAAITTNSATNGMMIVTFAPIAKTVTWLDPILTDGVLYIRQAMNTDYNQKNKTLEVI